MFTTVESIINASVRRYCEMSRAQEKKCRDIYWLVVFHSQAAVPRDILANFEISLAVFIPHTPRNRAISYKTFVQKYISDALAVKSLQAETHTQIGY